ncbi:MAG: extracellular solute-binding protein [Clostridia bacterium]|nr:extracellular solute-binding protein [Clostridia bacterium]
MKNKILMIIMLLSVLSAGCQDKDLNTAIPEKIITINDVDLSNTTFEKLSIPEDYDLRKFEGMTLNFIVENNLHAGILSKESEEFSNITGIDINVNAMDFDTLRRKINLDFISQAGKQQIIYVDPYQTLNRFYDYLEVLNPYQNNDDLPSVKGYTDDFIDNQVYVCSYFEEEDNLYTVPFDSTTMILYYRKDIFEKYKDAFFDEKGYDWTPGTKAFTWERYCEISEWIDKNVPDEEVKYGSGHMAQRHNSIFCDFSNILAAYGGDYFNDPYINTLGLKSFNHINVREESFIKALDVYKEVIKSSAPESIDWYWTDSARAFKNGEIAMMPNWDENYTYVEYDSDSKVSGKVGYSILPYGDVRSANIYGGSGIGINKYAAESEKEAAWFFITWATSKNMQLKVLRHPDGGSLPTRKSAYEGNQIKFYMENPEYIDENNISLKHMRAVLDAWKTKNIYLRPKISNFYKAEQVIIENLNNMVKNDMDSEMISEKIYLDLQKIKLQE